MAYTSVIPVHRLDRSIEYVKDKEKTTQKADSLEAAIDYAMNRTKTEQAVFEDTIGCTNENAYEDMVATKRRFHKMGGVEGYHLVQSFAEGEVTPELAHLIGQELADRLLKGQFEVVITTHLNTRHYHNHIVWNSVSMVDGHKYHSNAKSYYTEIRKISDDLCRKYGLSIIESNQKKSIPYVQWKAEQEGKPTWRTAIRLDIRESVQESYSWSQFLKEMEKRGYTWKTEPEIHLFKSSGNGTVYPSAFSWKKLFRRGNTWADTTAQGETSLSKGSTDSSQKETDRDSGTVLFLFISNGGTAKKTEKESIRCQRGYPETGPQD